VELRDVGNVAICHNSNRNRIRMHVGMGILYL
jgi:hypothetical protein